MEATNWLDHEDRECRQDRLKRLKWLVEQAPEGSYWQFFGGWSTKYLFEETRYCFVYGQFLAVILLGLSFVEHTLASLFFAMGRNDLERAGIVKLLDEARIQGYISESEHQFIDQARKVRNAFTHFRPPGDVEGIEYKVIQQDEFPYEIIERDATQMMMIVLQMLGKFSVKD